MNSLPSILRMPDAPSGQSADGPVGEVDLLISRAVDGVASRADWVLLEAAAHEDPAVWRRLALAQRDQELLTLSVRHAERVAMGVGLPTPDDDSAHDDERDVAGRVGPMARRAGWQSWGGWAVAAGLLVALSALRGTTALTGAGSSSRPGGGMQAGIVPSPFGSDEPADASSALATYLEQGQRDGTVLGEVPQKLLVRAQPLPGGGFDVVYVRQIVERTRVPDLFRFSADEAGNLFPIRVPAQVPGAPAVDGVKPASWDPL